MALSYHDRLAYEDVPEPRLEHYKIEFCPIIVGVAGRWVLAQVWDGRRWRVISQLATLGM